jgi:DNA-binding XRE family transcriptional regulator
MVLTEQQLRALRRSPVSDGGNRLQAAISMAGETQCGIARRLGMSNTTVSDVARGRYQTLTVEHAARYARLFGCHIEDLFPVSMKEVA